MAKTIIDGMTRRGFVGGTLALTAGAVFTTGASAQALEKAAVQYQAEPMGEQRCSNCVFWLPGPDPEGIGACSMVQGEIDPDGWCAIWAAAG